MRALLRNSKKNHHVVMSFPIHSCGGLVSQFSMNNLLSWCRSQIKRFYLWGKPGGCPANCCTLLIRTVFLFLRTVMTVSISPMQCVLLLSGMASTCHRRSRRSPMYISCWVGRLSSSLLPWHAYLLHYICEFMDKVLCVLFTCA